MKKEIKLSIYCTAIISLLLASSVFATNRKDPPAAAGSPYALKQPIKQLNTRQVPSISSKQKLMSVFRAIRDQRFLQDPNHPGTERTISWHFIGDGCETRAALAEHIANQMGITLAKLYVFGDLAVSSDIPLDGIVNWDTHVAVIAKVDNQVYVIDPALDFNAPMPLNAWYKAMTPVKRGLKGTLDDYQKKMKRYQRLENLPKLAAAVCDANAYNAYQSQCNKGQAIDFKQVIQDEQSLLSQEWNNYQTLGRDPELEFNTP